MSAHFLQNPIVEQAPLQDEIILFHPPTNKFCVLNRTSSFIWLRLQAPSTAEQLAGEVSRSFQGVTITESVRDVESLLGEMFSLGLICECAGEPPSVSPRQ